MNLYAESSAVLAWLLGEDGGSEIATLLAGADVVVASDLTLVECARVLIRAVALGELADAEAADRRAHLDAASTQWNVLRISPEIIERARWPFPGEPIRTLDALHLASALAARAAVPALELLSLDRRIRAAGGQLGFGLQPRDAFFAPAAPVPHGRARTGRTVDVDNFTAHFLRFVEEVEQGAEVVITRAGQPFARMVPEGSSAKDQSE